MSKASSLCTRNDAAHIALWASAFVEKCWAARVLIQVLMQLEIFQIPEIPCYTPALLPLLVE